MPCNGAPRSWTLNASNLKLKRVHCEGPGEVPLSMIECSKHTFKSYQICDHDAGQKGRTVKQVPRGSRWSTPRLVSRCSLMFLVMAVTFSTSSYL